MSTFIVGSGGVGSWLAPSLCMLIGSKNVVLVDGDTLEEGNLNRQLFTRQHLGRNKAEALAGLYGCKAIPEYYNMGRFRVTEDDWLVMCVDNHPARNAALNESDARGCRVICAANETHSAEAYYYNRGWRDSHLDPRVMFPELTTDRTGDPLAQAIGCTGEAQEQNPQLVTANNMAASLAAWLYVLWAIEVPKLSADVIPKLPHRLVSNMTRLENYLVGDKS